MCHDGNVTCTGQVPTGPGLYVFVGNGKVLYVGAAQNSLQKRMRSYVRRQRNKSSNRPVHVALAKAMETGLQVEVYTLEIAQVMELGPYGLPVNYLVGMEAGIIQELNPAWNRRGVTLIVDGPDD